MARFGQALKPSKPPQQLSSQPSAATFTGVPLTLPWYLPIGLRNCHVARFRQALNKTFKTSAAAFEGLRTSQPSAAAFGHGTSLSPTSCFYWASKLVRGTFWAGLAAHRSAYRVSVCSWESIGISSDACDGCLFPWLMLLRWLKEGTSALSNGPIMVHPCTRVGISIYVHMQVRTHSILI